MTIADNAQWCRNRFAMLMDQGIWGVPRSLLIFQRQGETLVLITRGPHPDASYQQEDYECIRSQFTAAGIPVKDQT